MYTEQEIKRMEAALALLRDSRQSVEGRLVRNTLRGGNVNVRQLLNEMESNLKLVGRIGDMWYLSSEGRNAADMGMKAYLQEQERKTKEPVPTKEVKDTYERRIERWQAWCGIIGGIIAIIDLVLRMLGIL